MEEHVRINIRNTRRIMSKTNEARNQRLRENRYMPLIKIISKHVDKTLPLLDIGIREGVLLEVLNEVGFTRLHGVDVYEKRVERANKLGFESKIADAQDFSFGKEFDIVIMSHVLEHCPEPLKVVENVYNNVLNDNGIMYVEVPTQKKEPVPTPHAHFYCFTSMKELLSFFDESRWDVVEKLTVGTTKSINKMLKIVVRKK